MKQDCVTLSRVKMACTLTFCFFHKVLSECGWDGGEREAFLNVTVLHDAGMAPTPSLGNTDASISPQAGGCDVVSGTGDPRMPVSRECTLPIACKTHTDETVNANLHSQPVLVINTHTTHLSN